MENLEYLKEVKKGDRDIVNNIHNLRNKDYPCNVGYSEKAEMNFRRVRTLEIIAEGIINLDNTLACINTTLENIETAINRG